ncbi:DUF4376 domain-containing protein [Azospirillum brasilense]|uniref:DUF4376 domain-containing protein n=1 Tax=Azospirillum argentinense TaxID=2970906 RepID=UPI00190E53C9|nr:DUF4376 domain-containing protein [Azospirillum argentinense]MBK3800468.1 DUF4376 domain-containing protein [Azospirillum argentinense]
MIVRYSASTGSFYPSDIDYPALPGDVVEITAEEHAALQAEKSAGKVIVPGADGRPTLSVVPPAEPAELPTMEPGSGSPMDAALAALAAKRYAVETGGIIVNGLPVATDDRAKTLLLGARLEVLGNPTLTLRWKTADGFVALSATQIVAISSAVRAHVQACFNREADLSALISAAADPASVDISTGWPS